MAGCDPLALDRPGGGVRGAGAAGEPARAAAGAARHRAGRSATGCWRWRSGWASSCTARARAAAGGAAHRRRAGSSCRTRWRSSSRARQLGELSRRRAGPHEIHVVATQYLILYVLIDAVRRFHAAFPHVRVRLEQPHRAGDRGGAARATRRWRWAWPPRTSRRPELEYQHLFSMDWSLIAPPRHPLLRKPEADAGRPGGPAADPVRARLDRPAARDGRVPRRRAVAARWTWRRPTRRSSCGWSRRGWGCRSCR